MGGAQERFEKDLLRELDKLNHEAEKRAAEEAQKKAQEEATSDE